MYKPKILVTGGDGRFAKILKEKNLKLNLCFATKKECNILSLNSLTKIIKKVRPKIVLHTAGLSRPMDIHEKNINKSINLNIIGTSNLVKVCNKFKIKIIYFSTSYVYEGLTGNYKETDPVKPFNNYGLSKLGGECAVRMYENSLTLRITMTEKPFMFKKAYDNLIANYMYHEDLVDILPKIINQKGIINIGGKTQSIYNFARSKNLNVKKVRLINTKKLPLRQSMNIGKLNKLLK
ncbi:sugar nucleotide-binding protein [Candidatus Pelagibacter sp.]|nr:sugar nucleotide-binding protein [Candidatus Pelagibacter sp.]